MAQVFDPRSGDQRHQITRPSQDKSAIHKHIPLPSTPQRNTASQCASTPGMLFQQQPSQAAARALNDIELDYQALYLDGQKERDYRAAKVCPDWETAWHAKVARYPNQGQPIYAAIIRYCPEAADACPGGNYALMPRQYLDAAATKAAMAGDLVAFRPMVRVGADLAHSALTKAALNGHDNIVEFLLNPADKVGLNPNHRYEHHGSNKLCGELTHVIAINSAANAKHVSTIKLLVRYGAYLSATDSRGDNALNVLLLHSCLESATVLINFYNSKENPLPCEKINYSCVGHVNKNILAQAIRAMKADHVELMYNLRDKLAKQLGVESSSISSQDIRADINCQNAITALLRSWITLCESIQQVSQLSPVAGNINPRTRHASMAPIAPYGSAPDSKIRLGYVQDLAIASPDFVKAIAKLAKNTTAGEVSNFSASVAELQLTMPTFRMC